MLGSLVGILVGRGEGPREGACVCGSHPIRRHLGQTQREINYVGIRDFRHIYVEHYTGGLRNVLLCGEKSLRTSVGGLEGVRLGVVVGPLVGATLGFWLGAKEGTCRHQATQKFRRKQTLIHGRTRSKEK